MTAKINKNNSARKKLIPAIAMLTVSAMTLASSTYAWFTMSREVEVTGLKMTATVPEDLQISLGQLGNAYGSTAATEANKVSLANSTGYLTYLSTGTTADNGAVAAPSANGWDWSNSADISAYYAFGNLMPASSNNGETIYFTPDAKGVGRDVKGDAKYYAANSTTSALKWNASKKTFDADGVATGSAEATLHALTSKTFTDGALTATDGWKDRTGSAKYTTSTAWNVTQDDGYYIDIPIWIRSSGSVDTNIRVDGYVLPGTTTATGKTETELELYRSVRVAILNGEAGANGIATVSEGATTYATTTEGSKVVANNIIPLVDAWDKANSATVANSDPVKYTGFKTLSEPYTPSAEASSTKKSILDSKIYDERMKYTATTAEAAGSLWGVSALTTYSDSTDYTLKTENVAPTYSKYTAMTANTAIATIKAPTKDANGNLTSEYGEMKKLIIRVWLDGEDEECWNDNAGQDWAISLRFSKIESST